MCLECDREASIVSGPGPLEAVAPCKKENLAVCQTYQNLIYGTMTATL
jgi:hypothetical protein